MRALPCDTSCSSQAFLAVLLAGAPSCAMSNGVKNTILQMDVVMEELVESKVQTEAEVKVSNHWDI